MPTPDLRDPGESTWDCKLHLGCGDRYLGGYVNIDAVGIPVNIASGDIQKIDIGDYYGGKQQHGHEIPERGETIYDVYHNIINPPYGPSTVDKIICIQALEHLSPQNLRQALSNWWTILKTNAPLILSVPDAEATLSMLRDEAKQEFAIRHLVGAMTNEYAHHLSWFKLETLLDLLDKCGFDCEVIKNIHFYPAIVLRCRKRDLYTPDRSYQELPYFAPTPAWKILDVGPGAIPFSLATEWIDVVERESLSIPGKVVESISETGYSPKRFDYVYCSHVFEHLEKPFPILNELMRIGRSGYIEVPSVHSDFFFQNGRVHDLWNCLEGAANTLVMVQRQPGEEGLYNFRPMGNLHHRITQQQVKLDVYQRRLREFFWSNQAQFNVSICWTGQSVKPHIICVRPDRVEQT